MTVQVERAGELVLSEAQLDEIATLLSKHPELSCTVTDFIKKLITGRESRWTGIITVNMQTGAVKEKPTIRAA